MLLVLIAVMTIGLISDLSTGAAMVNFRLEDNSNNGPIYT